jgi:hypothetical protein
MTYEQRLQWMNRPSDVDHQINDARKYIGMKQNVLGSARTEGDIKDSQLLLGCAIQTHRKLVQNRIQLKNQFYLLKNEDKQFA